MQLNKVSVDDINVKGKKVLVRVDFNVPLKDGKITNDNRIVAALPTINKLVENGAKIVLCSHLGKPKNGPEDKFSLKPAADRLAELVNTKVVFAKDDTVVGDNAKKAVAAGTAQLFAIDALIADLIQNYNEANQQVVDEFANSLFGRVAYLIQTKEAEQAFEAIGLTELYTVLKQLPDLLTLIIKYYPAGVDLTDFTNFNDFGSIFSDYLTGLIPETKVEWELDYDLAK